MNWIRLEMHLIYDHTLFAYIRYIALYQDIYCKEIPFTQCVLNNITTIHHHLSTFTFFSINFFIRWPSRVNKRIGSIIPSKLLWNMTSASNRRLNFIVKYYKNIKKELQNFVIYINHFIMNKIFPVIYWILKLQH